MINHEISWLFLKPMTFSIGSLKNGVTQSAHKRRVGVVFICKENFFAEKILLEAIKKKTYQKNTILYFLKQKSQV